MEISDVRAMLTEQLAKASHINVGLTIAQFRKCPMAMTMIHKLTAKLKSLEKSKHRLPEKFYRHEYIKLTTRRTKLLHQILRTRYVIMRERPLFSLMG